MLVVFCLFTGFHADFHCVCVHMCARVCRRVCVWVHVYKCLCLCAGVCICVCVCGRSYEVIHASTWVCLNGKPCFYCTPQSVASRLPTTLAWGIVLLSYISEAGRDIVPHLPFQPKVYSWLNFPPSFPVKSITLEQSLLSKQHGTGNRAASLDAGGSRVLLTLKLFHGVISNRAEVSPVWNVSSEFIAVVVSKERGRTGVLTSIFWLLLSWDFPGWCKTQLLPHAGGFTV